MTQRVCFVLQVRPELREEYAQWHRAVWPDMRAELNRTGWGNYSLFLRDDGLLVGYLETEDFRRAQADMAATAVNTRWQAAMQRFFVRDDGRPDEQIEALTEIFHLD